MENEDLLKLVYDVKGELMDKYHKIDKRVHLLEHQDKTEDEITEDLQEKSKWNWERIRTVLTLLLIFGSLTIAFISLAINTFKWRF